MTPQQPGDVLGLDRHDTHMGWHYVRPHLHHSPTVKVPSPPTFLSFIAILLFTQAQGQISVAHRGKDNNKKSHTQKKQAWDHTVYTIA